MTDKVDLLRDISLMLLFDDLRVLLSLSLSLSYSLFSFFLHLVCAILKVGFKVKIKNTGAKKGSCMKQVTFSVGFAYLKSPVLIT